jgi:hypothetical protein
LGKDPGSIAGHVGLSIDQSSGVLVSTPAIINGTSNPANLGGGLLLAGVPSSKEKLMVALVQHFLLPSFIRHGW